MCEGAWCLLPRRCISEGLSSPVGVKVEEELCGVADMVGAPPISHLHPQGCSHATFLLQAPPTTGPCLYLQVRHPGMPGSLHYQEQPSPVGWDQPVAHPHGVPVYPSRPEPHCPQQSPAHRRLHDPPPFPASPLMFPGMTSYMKSHTGALV